MGFVYIAIGDIPDASSCIPLESTLIVRCFHCKTHHADLNFAENIE